jgi:hypothetical protein
MNNMHGLGVGLCTNRVVVMIMKLNRHQDKVARGITTRAIVLNMIRELRLHGGVLLHAHTIIQDNLQCHLALIHKSIKNGGECHQTKGDMILGVAIKNNQQLQLLHAQDKNTKCILNKLYNTQSTHLLRSCLHQVPNIILRCCSLKQSHQQLRMFHQQKAQA